jgi:L-seryl-tRNA(Ser) seleniumtransferase
MLATTQQEIESRAQSFLTSISNNTKALSLELLNGQSAVGGGAGPTANLPTTLIAISHKNRSAQEIEAALRNCSPPIIARISDEKVLLDLRTVFADQELFLADALNNL